MGAQDDVLQVFRAAIDAASDDERLAEVCKLHKMNAALVMAEVAELVKSPVAKERLVGTWVIGELGHPERPFLDQRILLLQGCLGQDDSLEVRTRAILSLGELRDSRTEPIVRAYASSTIADIRSAVAQSLLSSTEDAESIAVLIKLTSDPVPAVRDWAVFTLGWQLEPPLPEEVSNALIRAATDEDDVVRHEAIDSLIRNGDRRGGQFLIDELAREAVDDALLEIVGELYTLWRDPQTVPLCCGADCEELVAAVKICDSQARHAAIRELVRHGDERGVDFLMKELAESGVSVDLIDDVGVYELWLGREDPKW